MENPYLVLDRRLNSIEEMLRAYAPQREEKLHTIKSLAEFAGVSPRTIQNWIIEGRVQAHTIGGVTRIKESQFINGMEEVKSLKFKRQ